MKYLIYMSTAVSLMTHDELFEILAASRRNNAAKNITGMLLYGEGTFVQVLEGEEETLNATYEVIKKDPRHHSLIRIGKGELSERNFSEWAMGFRIVNSSELSEIKGFVNTRVSDFLADNRPHPAVTILKTFVQSNHLNK